MNEVISSFASIVEAMMQNSEDYSNDLQRSNTQCHFLYVVELLKCSPVGSEILSLHRSLLVKNKLSNCHWNLKNDPHCLLNGL